MANINSKIINFSYLLAPMVFGDMPSKKKRKVAFFFATRANMCKMQSAMGGREDKGSQCSAPVPRSMMPTVDCGAPQYNAADILQHV